MSGVLPVGRRQRRGARSLVALWSFVFGAVFATVLVLALLGPPPGAGVRAEAPAALALPGAAITASTGGAPGSAALAAPPPLVIVPEAAHGAWPVIVVSRGSPQGALTADRILSRLPSGFADGGSRVAPRGEYSRTILYPPGAEGAALELVRRLRGPWRLREADRGRAIEIWLAGR